MDRIPPYDYATYVFAARAAVITCSLFELLQVFGSLEESSSFSKFFYFLFAGASAASSAYNIAMSTDGRDEIRKVVGNPDCETRGKSAFLVLAPVVAGIIQFICVSGNALFSFFVLIHVLISTTQLGTEAYEIISSRGSACKSNNPYAQPSNPSCGAPITSEKKPVASIKVTEPLTNVTTQKEKDGKNTQTPNKTPVEEPIYHTLERVKNEAEKKK